MEVLTTAESVPFLSSLRSPLKEGSLLFASLRAVGHIVNLPIHLDMLADRLTGGSAVITLARLSDLKSLKVVLIYID
jgi:hypothetical protein